VKKANIFIIHSFFHILGVYEFEFQVKGSCLKLVDVGGQRSERRKWLHCFEGVTAVIYVAALNECISFSFVLKLSKNFDTVSISSSLSLFLFKIQHQNI
jgi:hypothetical protein